MGSMLRLRPAPGLVAAAAVLASVVTPAATRAQPCHNTPPYGPLTVAAGTTAKLGGIQCHSQVTIEATGILRVIPYTAGDPKSGWLRLRADRIEIQPGGLIDAVGKGYQGTLRQGTGPSVNPTPYGGTPSFADANARVPGGGGAHVGKGGAGALLNGMAFDPYPGAAAGAAYDSEVQALALEDLLQGMGASGGAAQAGAPQPAATRVKGGAGGGIIILHARAMDIDGQVRADGCPHADFVDECKLVTGAETKAGLGGGAGGSVVLLVSNELSLGPSAILGAQGGFGRKGVEATTYGGGGGGGLVLVRSPLLPAVITPSGRVEGGASEVAGGVDPTPVTQAEPGAIGADNDPKKVPCIDVDNDGFRSQKCGGDDCNDFDPKIHPSTPGDPVKESCGPADEDCDGLVDFEQPGVTASSLCGDGSGEICVDPDGDGVNECQPGGGGGAAPAPKDEIARIELSGGLCRAAPGARGRGLGWLGAVGASALGYGLRRAGRSTRSRARRTLRSC
jgi:hypothetical protein